MLYSCTHMATVGMLSVRLNFYLLFFDGRTFLATPVNSYYVCVATHATYVYSVYFAFTSFFFTL